MNKTKNIIFDLDGTLVDSAPGIICALELSFAACDIAPSLPIGAISIGPPLREMLGALAPTASRSELDFLAQTFANFYDSDGCHNSPFFPGVNKMLLDLHNSPDTLYLITNKRAKPTSTILANHSWTKYFSKILSPDSFGPTALSKKQLILNLIKLESLSPDTCMYLGDSYGDYIASIDAGINFARAEWGYTDMRLDSENLLLSFTTPLAFTFSMQSTHGITEQLPKSGN